MLGLATRVALWECLKVSENRARSPAPAPQERRGGIHPRSLGPDKCQLCRPGSGQRCSLSGAAVTAKQQGALTPVPGNSRLQPPCSGSRDPFSLGGHSLNTCCAQVEVENKEGIHGGPEGVWGGGLLLAGCGQGGPEAGRWMRSLWRTCSEEGGEGSRPATEGAKQRCGLSSPVASAGLAGSSEPAPESLHLEAEGPCQAATGSS